MLCSSNSSIVFWLLRAILTDFWFPSLFVNHCHSFRCCFSFRFSQECGPHQRTTDKEPNCRAKAHLDQATRAIKNEVDKGKTSSSKGGKKRSANSGDINPRQAQQFKLSDQELENEVLRWFEFSGYWELKVLQQKLGEKSRERLKRVLQKFCNLIKQGPNRNKYHLKGKV